MNNVIPFDWNDREFADIYDELPLWSASFGQLLLENAPLQPDMTVLDVGCGTGFPLLELAGRLGQSSHVTGLDIWQPALQRARKKRDFFQRSHVSLVAYNGGEIPFRDTTFDMVTSNLGVNNFSDPQLSMQECYRVTKPDGKLVMTTNLVGHMKEFYTIYRQVLVDFGNPVYIEQMDQQEAHRGDIGMHHDAVTSVGYRLDDMKLRHFRMNYANGTALFQHPMIRFGFLPGWVNCVDESDRETIFVELEQRLNAHAAEQGILRLTIPMLCIIASK